MNAAKLSIFLVLLCINIIPVAATVQDLLNSYNYNFYNGTINVISQSDYMIDKNSNGKDDTLTISIATDASPGTYKFIVEIVDKNGILINNTQKTISASDFSATINFPFCVRVPFFVFWGCCINFTYYFSVYFFVR